MKDVDIWHKGENSLSKYYGYGQDITVIEMPRFDDYRRFLCLTDRVNDCKHTRAVKEYLMQGEPPVLV